MNLGGKDLRNRALMLLLYQVGAKGTSREFWNATMGMTQLLSSMQQAGIDICVKVTFIPEVIVASGLLT